MLFRSRCDQTVCSVDLTATAAEILQRPLPDDAGEDSVSLLPLLKGEVRPIHDAVVHQSIQGVFAIRRGKWKLIFGPGSGGWSEPHEAAAIRQGLPRVQLYDLETDLAESKNLADTHPQIVAELRLQMKKLVADGRSTPGEPQRNNVEPKLEKF